ncbi:FCS-Like Zinc finger 10-like [Humulus lupulus]|uniref:FCS-Like Zinc finger 10-like n=1 Tax=Humulus lupulus TaxID=3486 RepID=UPI002B4144E7|nr:FCS-Like Zinc finger 10-like [Humulus lupulus]
MLRKRTRSIQKDQHQMGPQPLSDSGSESFSKSDIGNNMKGNSFYSVPGLLVGLSPNVLTDCDSVRSPTSPLDFRLFSSLGNPFRSTKSSQDGQHRSWGGGTSNKVGLSIVDSLADDTKNSGKVLRSSESKNILFGLRLRIKIPNGQTNTNYFESPKSLPKNYPSFHFSKTKSPLQKGSSDVFFEIGDSPLEPGSLGKIRSCSLDSCRTISNLSGLNNFNRPYSTSMNFCLERDVTKGVGSSQIIDGSPKSNLFSGTKLSTIPGSIGSVNEFGSLSASEIELSEDYTCVITHGPNPKTTRIYGDCILDTHSNDLSNSCKNEYNKDIGRPELTKDSKISVPFPSDNFLSFCYHCKKKLAADKDIYIYRGEKAFCSLDCRSLEILIDEELEKSNDKSSEIPG